MSYRPKCSPHLMEMPCTICQSEARGTAPIPTSTDLAQVARWVAPEWPGANQWEYPDVAPADLFPIQALLDVIDTLEQPQTWPDSQSHSTVEELLHSSTPDFEAANHDRSPDPVDPLDRRSRNVEGIARRDLPRPPDTSPQPVARPTGAEEAPHPVRQRDSQPGPATWPELDTSALTAEQAENLREAESILRETGWVEDGPAMCLECGSLVPKLTGFRCATCTSRDREEGTRSVSSEAFLVTEYGQVNRRDRRGDGLDGDEFLMHSFLRVHGVVGERRGQYNSALFLPEALHDELTRIQGREGLRPERFREMSILEFFELNLRCMRQAGIPRSAARTVLADALEQVPTLVLHGVPLYPTSAGQQHHRS